MASSVGQQLTRMCDCFCIVSEAFSCFTLLLHPSLQNKGGGDLNFQSYPFMQKEELAKQIYLNLFSLAQIT